jgi:small subunit ribosomal protein S20
VKALANIKSAVKRARTQARRAERNRAIRSRVRTAMKRAQAALDNPLERELMVRKALREIDKAVTKGVLHKNAAARRKSRLARALNAQTN